MRVGQARKRDANEQGICRALKAVGATIFRVSVTGGPDLVVGYKGRWWALEVKSATGKPTPAQAKQLQLAAPILTIRSVEDALQLIGVKG